MPVCRFYLKGNCRYGRNCRFEHPGENDYSQDDNVPANFSFKSALSDISPNQNFSRYNYNSNSNNYNYNNTATNLSGFSFTRALQQVAPQNEFSAADVDMSDVGYPSFNNPQNNLGGFFSQTYNALQNQHQTQYQQPQVSTIFSQFQPQQQQYPYQQHQQQLQQQSHLSFHSVSNLPPSADGIHKLSGTTTTNLNHTQKVPPHPNFSNLEDLSDAELKAYESDKFELGKVPVRPPPKALC